MPTTVYTLLCQTDRTGQVLGVFADRVHAAEIARSCATTHAEKLRRQDQQTFKAPESFRWLVHGFEIVPNQE